MLEKIPSTPTQEVSQQNIAKILSPIFNNTRLIMLDDPAQLPPVGAGQPFVDALENNLIQHTMLTKIYRQSDDKAITLIAQQVREGSMPKFSAQYTDAFYVNVNTEEREETNNKIENIVLKSCANNAWGANTVSDDEQMKEYLYRYQIITPRKTGALGAEAINAKARNVLLPFPDLPTAFKAIMPICMYEKVIHLKNENMKTTNDKEVRVFNGMIGMVIAVNAENEEITVRYPLEGYSVVYKDADIKAGMLGYAWALTIHKTQGAEFGTVAIPITNSHWNMLNSRLLYTAITRAKNKVGLIGESKALWRGATNTESIKRLTVLPFCNIV